MKNPDEKWAITENRERAYKKLEDCLFECYDRRLEKQFVVSYWEVPEYILQQLGAEECLEKMSEDKFMELLGKNFKKSKFPPDFDKKILKNESELREKANLLKEKYQKNVLNQGLILSKMINEDNPGWTKEDCLFKAAELLGVKGG